MNYKKICLEVCQIAKRIGKYLIKEIVNLKPNDIGIKSIHNYVTYVDKQSELQLITELKKIGRDFEILSEENFINLSSEAKNYWIIDPLDGTTNYIHKIPLYSISIALMVDNELKVGVIYEPNLDECFYAWKGGGSFLNNRKITVSDTKNLDDSLLATGFPFYDYSKLEQYIEFLKFTMRATSGVRRLGSAAVDLAYVAAGRFDGFFEYGLKPWDVAAGVLLVQEAGGKVCDFSKGNNYLFGKEIIASNNYIFEQLYEEFNKYFTN